MDDRKLFELLANELGFSRSERKELAKDVKKWDADTRVFEKGVREAEVLSESDLAVRINVRDDS